MPSPTFIWSRMKLRAWYSQARPTSPRSASGIASTSSMPTTEVQSSSASSATPVPSSTGQ